MFPYVPYVIGCYNIKFTYVSFFRTWNDMKKTFLFIFLWIYQYLVAEENLAKDRDALEKENTQSYAR